MRWRYYALSKGPEVSRFWAKRLKMSNRNVLCILGLGFDSRTCEAIRMLTDAGGKGRLDVILIEFDEGPDSPSRTLEAHVAENRRILTEILQGSGDLKVRQLI